MDTDFWSRLLLWSLLINYAILLVWFAALVFARDRIYRLHGKWFSLPKRTFDAIHYGGMAGYKIGILIFNLAPLIALCVVA